MIPRARRRNAIRAQLLLADRDPFIRFNYGPMFAAYVCALRRDLRAAERNLRELTRRPVAPPTRRPPSRPRGARPRAQATRSSAASGDSPDDDPEPPALRLLAHARRGRCSPDLARLLDREAAML